MNISQEYIASIVVVILSVLRAFHIEVASDLVTSAVTGVAALYVIYRKWKKGEITLAGVRK